MVAIICFSILQVMVKLAQQLADGTVDKSELYKYRNEFSKDMELPTKASEVARSAPVAKADDERDIERPRKMIKRPDASPTSFAEARFCSTEISQFVDCFCGRMSSGTGSNVCDG